MRDVITIPFNAKETLIISSDNSGAIGMKENDSVHVPYETVAYYSFRVAVMECIAAGGKPISVVLQNFCGNKPWDELICGIKKGLHELGLEDLTITGSTESNFALLQSAMGLIVLGKKSSGNTTELDYSKQLRFAIIGAPLVGNEVVEQEHEIVPLSLFQKISMFDEAIIWPVGSKGILFELNQMFTNVQFTKEMMDTNVDIVKSSGPSTCFIVGYQSNQEEALIKLAGRYFHSLNINYQIKN